MEADGVTAAFHFEQQWKGAVVLCAATLSFDMVGVHCCVRGSLLCEVNGQQDY